VNRLIAVILALLAAVHVSVPAAGLPAPVPVLVAFAAVILGLCWLIWEAACRSGLYWRAGA
jgi:hypothetical protein